MTTPKEESKHSSTCRSSIGTKLFTWKRLLLLTKMWKLFVVEMLSVALVSAACPEDCHCPPKDLRCAAGVSIILDSCGCCKVCARQLFEDCSKTQPCDHTKGLECNFGGGFDSAKGICRAKTDGRTCEYNNKIYQNGEIFRPTCKHQCTCMDGAVGCVSLCPRELLLPKLHCAKPRQVKARGQCCEQLICPEEEKTESSVVKKNNKDRISEDNSTKKNELASIWRGKAKSLPAFSSHPLGHMVAKEVKCVAQTTSWSPCSKSCGTGLSTRMTNNNSQCKMVTETRICEVRPCQQKTFSRFTNGQKCNTIEKATRPVRLLHSGCRSLKNYQPRYCGTCSDGRCCRPQQTQTIPVLFRCKNGVIIKRMMMMIESCECNLKCLDSNKKTPASHRSLNKHKLKI